MKHGALIRCLTPFTEGGSSASASGGLVSEDAEAKVDGVIGENEEEARRPRIARRPQTPTKAEYDAHMTLHADYRDWCPDCVAGRGISHQHRSSKKKELKESSALTTHS